MVMAEIVHFSRVLLYELRTLENCAPRNDCAVNYSKLSNCYFHRSTATVPVLVKSSIPIDSRTDSALSISSLSPVTSRIQ